MFLTDDYLGKKEKVLKKYIQECIITIIFYYIVYSVPNLLLYIFFKILFLQIAEMYITCEICYFSKIRKRIYFSKLLFVYTIFLCVHESMSSLCMCVYVCVYRHTNYFLLCFLL